ncbi:MAG TPA: hypothetical protein VJ991_09045 [Balneolales bacterium]|nr:hypothetical protein [Balneolales bacterium]
MRHTGEGALIGATTVGVFFGMFFGLSSRSGNGGFVSNESMTVTGGLLGALIGSKSRDRWERIPVKVTLGS